MIISVFSRFLVLIIANQSSVTEKSTGTCWDCDYSMHHGPNGFVLRQIGAGEFIICSTPERDLCMSLGEC